MKNKWELNNKENGTIREATKFDGSTQTVISFRDDSYNGPTWYITKEGEKKRIHLSQSSEGQLEGNNEGISFTLKTESTENSIVLKATMTNHSRASFQPQNAGIQLGIDTYMNRFPEWNHVYFPTLLRCEKTHFWGYFMTPMGEILGIGSPDSIASWHLSYNRLEGGDLGHRIHTANVDLLNELPLPDRHPQHLNALKPCESREWTIYLHPVDNLNELKPELSKLCQAPMLEFDKYTIMPNEQCTLKVYHSEPVTVNVYSEDNTLVSTLPKTHQSNAEYDIGSFISAGVYTVKVSDDKGKQAEGKFHVRKPWSWYLKEARKEAIRKPQKASTHAESWYGQFSAILAKKYFPDATLDPKAEQNFQEILELMFDTEKAEPFVIPQRIQNTSTMISLLVDYYEVNRQVEDLELASRLADWLIQNQADDGSYRSAGTEHYSSVIYPVKSLMELLDVEKSLSHHDSFWKESYERHFQSVERAIDNLLTFKDNIDTEGELTFEDGMISCTALQLALFSYYTDEPKQYIKAAEELISKHRCLQQRMIPDARMRGATLRFWEAQYDVVIHANMMNSPHGWTSWKTYATWYLYQLTGKIAYLRDTMDTIGTSMQMIDINTGNLRWAFVPDPFIKTKVFEEGASKGEDVYQERVLGEQYVDMISEWWKPEESRLVCGYPFMPMVTKDGVFEIDKTGSCCDNDVHEHFKCLEEVALTSAYIYESTNQKWEYWNCEIKILGDTIRVFPHESIVQKVHVNVTNSYDVIIGKSKESIKISKNRSGLCWIDI